MFQSCFSEFVKNLHQIYKYNCTQKDEFIKKGLGKSGLEIRKNFAIFLLF